MGEGGERERAGDGERERVHLGNGSKYKSPDARKTLYVKRHCFRWYASQNHKITREVHIEENSDCEKAAGVPEMLRQKQDTNAEEPHAEMETLRRRY